MKTKLKVRIGGLMRCCLQTLAEAELEFAKEGTILQCKFTDDKLHSMRVRNGAWEWNHD